MGIHYAYLARMCELFDVLILICCARVHVFVYRVLLLNTWLCLPSLWPRMGDCVCAGMVVPNFKSSGQLHGGGQLCLDVRRGSLPSQPTCSVRLQLRGALCPFLRHRLGFVSLLSVLNKKINQFSFMQGEGGHLIIF